MGIFDWLFGKKNNKETFEQTNNVTFHQKINSEERVNYLQDRKRRIVQLLYKLENEGIKSLSSDEKKLLNNIGMGFEVEELSSEDFPLELQIHRVEEVLANYENDEETVSRLVEKRIKSLQKDFDKNKASLIIFEGDYPDNDVVVFEGKLEKLDEVEWFDEDRPIELRGKPGSFLDFLFKDEISGAKKELKRCLEM